MIHESSILERTYNARNQKEQEAQQQAAKHAYQNNLQGYNRAKGTCLEGRGYSVSY